MTMLLGTEPDSLSMPEEQLVDSVPELMVPKSFLNLLFRQNGHYYLFLAEIATQKGYLMEFNQEPFRLEIIKEFEISSGKQKGAKRSEWDLRTPIGLYEITQFRPGNTLAEKFGPGAYVLDYPNPLERLERRTGSGIWIHGTDRVDFIDYDSEGCIRIKNNELPFLNDYLRIGQSPVIIVERIEWISITELLEFKEKFEQRFDDWLTTWQENDIDNYLSFYHPSFYAPNLNMDIIRWNNHKRDISLNNPPQEINLSAKKIIFRDNKLLVQAIQQYKSATFTDTGTKSLIWEMINGNWYLTLEDWKAE